MFRSRPADREIALQVIAVQELEPRVNEQQKASLQSTVTRCRTTLNRHSFGLATLVLSIARRRAARRAILMWPLAM